MSSFQNHISETMYEQSYRMVPENNEKFLKSDVEREVGIILKRELENKGYVPKDSLGQSKELTKIILDRLREMNYPRYKFVVQVTITSNEGQGMRVCSRCLWDNKQDNFASIHFKTDKLLCVAVIFGIFYE